MPGSRCSCSLASATSTTDRSKLAFHGQSAVRVEQSGTVNGSERPSTAPPSSSNVGGRRGESESFNESIVKGRPSTSHGRRHP